MASSLADLLCRRAAAVLDPAARVQLFRALLAEVPEALVREAREVLVERAGMRDTGAQVALLALQLALSAGPRGVAVQGPAPRVSESEPGDPAQEPLEAHELAPVEDPRAVPDYGRGRPLTLGERKSLARRSDRRLLERALRDPHPDVIALLLQNPRITEDDVVRICARRPGSPAVLARVFGNPKWSSRARVRSSLALNPATPEDIAASLVPLLCPEDIREVARDERIAAGVRRRCFEVLARLPPTPVDPTGRIH